MAKQRFSKDSVEAKIQKIIDDFGGVELFSEENANRLRKAFDYTSVDSINVFRERVLLLGARKKITYLYSQIGNPVHEQQVAVDSVFDYMMSVGFSEDVSYETVTWFSNILNLPKPTPKHVKVEKEMGEVEFRLSETLEEIEDDLYEEILEETDNGLFEDVVVVTRKLIELAAKVVVTDEVVKDRICFNFKYDLRPSIGCQSVKSVEFKTFKNGDFGIFFVLIDEYEHKSVWNAALFNPIILSSVFAAFYTQHKEEKTLVNLFIKVLEAPFGLQLLKPFDRLVWEKKKLNYEM